MTNNQIATAKNSEVTAAQIPNSQRFANKILKEFSDSAGNIQIGEKHRRLIQSYFIGISRALTTAEANRVRKNANNKDHKYDEPLAYTWNNVDLNASFAQALVQYAKLGVDMTLPNQLAPVLFKDNKINKYTCSFIIGYEGRRIIAQKYALNPFVNVITELVYETDEFIPHKKDNQNPSDTYEFRITNPFNRGPIVGAFGYVIREDARQNELFILTKEQIDKRKPEKAAAEFWGGTKTVYEDGKRVTKEVAGWYEEMALKTMKNYVYKHITIDAQKVDETYTALLAAESDINEKRLASEVSQHANNTVIDIEAETPMAPPVQPAEPAQLPEQTVTAQAQQPAPVQQQVPADADFEMAEIAAAEKENSAVEAMNPMF